MQRCTRAMAAVERARSRTRAPTWSRRPPPRAHFERRARDLWGPGFGDSRVAPSATPEGARTRLAEDALLRRARSAERSKTKGGHVPRWSRRRRRPGARSRGLRSTALERERVGVALDREDERVLSLHARRHSTRMLPGSRRRAASAALRHAPCAPRDAGAGAPILVSASRARTAAASRAADGRRRARGATLVELASHVPTPAGLARADDGRHSACMPLDDAASTESSSFWACRLVLLGPLRAALASARARVRRSSFARSAVICASTSVASFSIAPARSVRPCAPPLGAVCRALRLSETDADGPGPITRACSDMPAIAPCRPTLAELVASPRPRWSR